MHEIPVKGVPKLASVLRVGERTIHAWRNAGMPTRGRGEFELGEVIEWARANVWTSKVNDSTEEGERLRAAELLKAEATAARAALRFRKEAGELIERAVAISLLCTQAAMVRTRLQAMPGEIASSFPPELRHDLMLELENKICLVLIDMRNQSTPAIFSKIVRLVEETIESMLREDAQKKPRRKKPCKPPT